MKPAGVWVSLRAALQRPQLKPTIILSVSTVTLITWRCFASPQFYLQRLSGRFVWFSDPLATAAIYSFLGALLLLGLIPALIVKCVFHEKLADYGVRFGDRVRTPRSLLVCVPIIVLIAYCSARSPSFAKEYPINPNACASPQAFALHALSYLLYYLGWEFQFRGFMQHGLEESIGAANSLLVQVMASSIMHVGKPTGEIFGSILGGLAWGVFAYRTRSILSGLIQHFLLGILVDAFICRLR